MRHNIFFFSSRGRHTRSLCDWSSDVCSSDLAMPAASCAGASEPRASRSATTSRGWWNAPSRFFPAGTSTPVFPPIERSEERRVGKECKLRSWPEVRKEKKDIEYEIVRHV